MPLPASQPPAIDESRRGILTINDGGMAGLLGLPANHRIEEMRVTTTGNLQIEIVGEDMPPGLLPKPVMLTVHVAGDRRELSWAHKPEKRWRLR